MIDMTLILEGWLEAPRRTTEADFGALLNPTLENNKSMLEGSVTLGRYVTVIK